MLTQPTQSNIKNTLDGCSFSRRFESGTAPNNAVIITNRFDVTSRGSPQPRAACNEDCDRVTHHHFDPLSPLPSLHPLRTKDCKQSVTSMSSTVQAISSTSSTSNIQLITDALIDYAKITGIDLSKNPFAAAIERANSPGDILELLQEREKAFKDYREGNRRLFSCLSPAVNVIHAFSGILGEAVSLHTFHLVTHLT